ncbi:MAG: alcohol dehydrogenase catalytic domain-containing protein [Verrucomicrobiae bacterium]|nr:alcohol dehydrogenase catalytic domain-containing protein [Verrucomicrobiae bacterium]
MSEATAAIFNGPDRPFALRALPLPAPGAGEALVEILLATICGSDLHTVTGRRVEPSPSVLGHEAVGRVLAVGEGRDPAWIGRRVTWTLADSCGRCPACRTWHLPQKCERLFKYGHASLDDGTGLNGCYSTHLILRAGTALVPVPDAVSDAAAAPANCALATMVSATEPLATGGDTVVIQGAGLLGLYAAALLKDLGWRRVLVTDPVEERLAFARAVGAEGIGSREAAQLPDRLADAVIEVCGSPEVVPEGVRWLRPGGHYALVGMVHPQSHLDITGESVIRKCLTLRGTHNYAPRHLAAAVEFLARHAGEPVWESLVSPPWTLEHLNEAFAAAHGGTWPRVSVRPVAVL